MSSDGDALMVSAMIGIFFGILPGVGFMIYHFDGNESDRRNKTSLYWAIGFFVFAGIFVVPGLLHVFIKAWLG